MIFKSFEIHLTLDEELVIDCLECAWEERLGVAQIYLNELIHLAGRHYLITHMGEEEKREDPEGPDG